MNFCNRRKELFKKIGDKDIAVVFSAKKDAPRQDSDFYYLTGFTEYNAIAVFYSGKFILFNQSRDTAKEIWCGEYVGQERACLDFGADKSFPIEKSASILNQLLAGKELVYSNINDFYSYIDIKTPSNLVSIGDFLHEKRRKKSSYEINIMRRAAEITAEGHLRAMRKCRPGIHEFELEAELLYEFMRLGGCREAFKSIVGSGANACTLHYSKNNNKLIDGDLVLIDAGAEYKHYCADVSRTYPVNGKFTKNQRTIYDIVLEMQLETIANIKPGVKFANLQLAAENVIIKHLGSAGKQFFIHKIGHWLGLDVHDVGKYDILEPGMVLTVEPGIYISSDNIGVRIEDDVLVTEDGCEVLTKMIPKTALEIEIEMRKNRDK